MTIELATPVVADLPRVIAQLSGWQDDDWPGHLHPGDVGWHSMVGAEQTATHLRLWTRDAALVAVGMLDAAGGLMTSLGLRWAGTSRD